MVGCGWPVSPNAQLSKTPAGLVMIDGKVTAAERDVLAERRRQPAEGFNAAHDDAHINGEIAQAAALYALVATPLFHLQRHRWEVLREWLAIAASWVFVNKPARRCLVIAAALLIAEIERIDRRDARRDPLPATPGTMKIVDPEPRSRLSIPWPKRAGLRRFLQRIGAS